MIDVAGVVGLRGLPPDRTASAALAAFVGAESEGDSDIPFDPHAPRLLQRRIGPAGVPDVRGPPARWLVAGDVRLDARDGLAHSLGLEPGAAVRLSDLELVHEAFERWGANAPEHLLGGFAIIAWERATRRLHLVCDTSAEKLLYFRLDPHRVIVATRAPIILAVPGVPRAVDPSALIGFYDDLLENGPTPLAGIEAVAPGRAVVIGPDGNCVRRRWWHPPSRDAWTRLTIDEPRQRFNEVFRAAVADRLRGDLPAGGFCSGGLDSTAVAAVAADVLAAQGRTYRTYTSVPHPDWRRREPSPRVDDEREYVRMLARRHPNIIPTFVATEGVIFLDCLPVLFAGSGGPLRNTPNAGWYLAIEDLMTADGVRRPLNGNLGNATMSLNADILVDLLEGKRLRDIARELRASPREFLHAVVRLLDDGVRGPVLRRVGAGGPGPGHEWRLRVALRPEVAARYGLRAREAKRDIVSLTLGTKKQLFQRMLESIFRLAPVNRQVDHLDPTIDRRLVELCWSLPPTEFRRGSTNRRLVRRAMRGLVPDEIRLRGARGAQAPDEDMHLSRRLDDLRDAVEFIARDALCSNLIDIPELRRWLAGWPRDEGAPGLRASIPHLRALAMGLYIRWINDGLTSLPGARPLPPPIVTQG